MLVYLGVNMFMEYWDLIDVLHDLDGIVANILRTMVNTAICIGLIQISKHRKQLEELIVAVRRDITDGASFENDEEKQLYLNYNTISYNFGKCTTIIATGITVLLWSQPLIEHLASSNKDNNTASYELPLQVHVFFDYHTVELYTLLYAFQMPSMYIPMYHVAEVSFIVNMVLHLCGKLSILSYRIRNIDVRSSESFQVDLKRMVAMHLELIKLSKTLNDCFDIILLIELMSCGSRLGLALYIVLIKIADPLIVANFLLYSINVGAFLYIFSYVGEQVMYESRMIGEAFYSINWHRVASNDRKSLLICITNGQRIMYVTAGTFYIFSRSGFTEIVKTSMACLSLLQAKM
ncbi:odorant receptor 4-like [Hylaeus volcanicus]|uniref:odorant receptor 4-like n=1 Tax=Hylaeus volcanicus TaxID=313075 RepID=UPI0023B837FE|nr:odorant receptor 4-like [Hylaeus volcanicus]